MEIRCDVNKCTTILMHILKEHALCLPTFWLLSPGTTEIYDMAVWLGWVMEEKGRMKNREGEGR